MKKLQDIKDSSFYSSETTVELNRVSYEWLIEQAKLAEKYRDSLKSIQRFTVGKEKRNNLMGTIYDHVKQTLEEK